MIRYNEPFNGERFLLNKDTNEIHDLSNESSLCHIEDMNVKNIEMIELEDDMIYLCQQKGCNGCYWCNSSYNNESIIY